MKVSINDIVETMDRVSYIPKAEARRLILSQVILAIDHYLGRWNREDGSKFQLNFEFNPDLIEDAYGKG